MRIAMLCHNYVPHPGGLEIMVQNLARGLARNHEVVLVTSSWDGVRGASREDGFTVHRLGALHLIEDLGIPYPVPLGPGLADALAAMKSAELVHVHGALYASSILGALLARRRRVPLLLTEHVGFVQYRRRAVNAVEDLAWSLIGNGIVAGADAVTTYNARVQEWLAARFPRTPVRYIGNGVDFHSFRPRAGDERRALRESFGLPQDKTLVLYAGRASEKKNIDLVLRIPRDAFHLVVCGWKRDLREPGLTDLGVLPHARMPDLFGCVDMMVHASVGEGLPLAVQEGIASGLPLVLLWDHGYRGWIDPQSVARCDSLDEIGPRVRALAVDAAQRSELGRRARRWAESTWSWEATVDAYDALYRQAIAGRIDHA
jgi:D-inositol-3-phosphate glycosyltransferase